MNLLGISRSPRFSPNSADRDAAIFASVSSRLLRRHEVSVINEDLFVAVDLEEFDGVFSMARSTDVLQALAKEEERSKLHVLNSARSLLALSRGKLTQLIRKLDIAQPKSVVLTSPFEPTEAASLHYPLWLKRGDACAQANGDVRFLETADQLAAALQDFNKAGFGEAVVCEHLQGDLIKFYGIEGTGFFRFDYATENGRTGKFGLEIHNGEPQHFPFAEDELRQEANHLAAASGLIVYGGDAVVDSTGRFRLIDFNDWPSFGSYRKEAAQAIAKRMESYCNP